MASAMEQAAARGEELARYGIHVPEWQRNVWTWCAMCLMVLIGVLVALVAVMLWQLIDLLRPEPPDNRFVFAGMSMMYSCLLRVLAILIGGAIAFAGLAVSFFAHQQTSSMGADGKAERGMSWSVALATSSPGIIGVVIGAVIIVASLMQSSAHLYEFGAQGNAAPGLKLPALSEILKDKDPPPAAPR